MRGGREGREWREGGEGGRGGREREGREKGWREVEKCFTKFQVLHTSSLSVRGSFTSSLRHLSAKQQQNTRK